MLFCHFELKFLSKPRRTNRYLLIKKNHTKAKTAIFMLFKMQKHLNPGGEVYKLCFALRIFKKKLYYLHKYFSCTFIFHLKICWHFFMNQKCLHFWYKTNDQGVWLYRFRGSWKNMIVKHPFQKPVIFMYFMKLKNNLSEN